MIYRWWGCHNILDRISPKIGLTYFNLESPCHTLKKKHVFWYPLSSGILLNISKHLFTNISEQNTQKFPLCFISWLVHSLLYSWQSFSLITRPQKITTPAFVQSRYWKNNVTPILFYVPWKIKNSGQQSYKTVTLYCNLSTVV